MKITKDMAILEVLKEYPEARDVFVKHNLGCSDCLGANSEKIKDVAQSHDIDLDELVSDLNDLVD
ncbi:DUF1858 domain-containing protein [Selenihalanaerobacter shriftii]|uniref:Hybrid cluster protein-associated redox disulfide domain-containing protein n=1 Tax=Selenihalanaerobacter shriftii TaxID=142842 RepID=A0A1T4JJE3_9FIRM|nr:DUF1858 domain-containing protein [Selenihalanaerobacter shriftii]SJZ30295.1 hybrid cluster protein-associated redox disulfide domain-containing protein [Selenihalanaerobacter shriftii]